MATVTKVAASRSCQSWFRLAIIHAASGRNSATSSGSACGDSASSRIAGVGPELLGDRGSAAADDVGLGDQREACGADHEGDRERPGLLVHPAREPASLGGGLRQRAARDEAGDAGHGVERQHERISKEHLRVVVEAGRLGVAGNHVSGGVGRGQLGHRVDGAEQPERDHQAQREPRSKHLERPAVPAPERQLGVMHPLDEDKLFDAHLPLRSAGRAASFSEPAGNLRRPGVVSLI